jgi:Carboxypeptidase regulatory-like domain
MAPKKAPDNALVVKAFSYPTSTEGNGPEDPGVQPLAGVTVTLKTDAPDPSVPDQERVTGPDGEARFENLKATRDLISGSDYKLAFERPPGIFDATVPDFKPPTEVFIDDEAPQEIDTTTGLSPAILVREGGEVVVQVGMAPLDGTVTGTVQIAGPTPVGKSGVQVEARQGGVLVDAVETASGPTPPAGFYALVIDRLGLIEIVPQSPIDHDGRTFKPRPDQRSQFVLVRPREEVDGVDVDYEPTGAEILVGALLVEEVDGEEEPRTLDGVTFRLFELTPAGGGPPDQEPIREVVTRPNVVSSFPELGGGSYRIEVLPPASSNGQRLQLTRPSTPALTILVEDGQRIDLSEAFEFRPVKGSVLGSVVVARDGTPLPGVAVVLSSMQQPQLVRRETTDDEGEYQIDELSPGQYRVALEQAVVTALGARWELEGDGDGARTVEVRPRATTLVPEFRMVEEEHLITGRVLGPGGFPAAFVVVQIFRDVDDVSDNTKQPLDNVLTDQDGFYRFKAPTAGTFFIRVREEDGFASQLTPVTVNRPTTAPTLFTSTRAAGGGGTGGAGGNGSGGASPVTTELNDFPFLTEEVDLGGRGGPAQPGGAGAVGQTVERALREVLGWRPRASDPKGFQAALLQAFTSEEVAGHTEYHWNPRSYAVEIQADLGAVTGAQASLYNRAKAAVDQVLPLLDGLEPLRVDFDPENVAAIRAIVRSQLTELVKELGIEGGPRVQRIDQLFSFLLGDTIVAADPRARRDPDLVGGSLGILRDRFGLRRFLINDVGEEGRFSDFLILVDHVVSLAESWDAQREFFVRGSTLVEPFLGTQLVLLSRDLEVIAESVHEVEFALDSVFLGPSERQTLELRFPPGSASNPLPAPGTTVARSSPPMFLSELLEWVERFATEEGRQLIDEGGKQAVVVAFRPTILLLQALVRDARVSPAGAQDPTRMPDAYRRPRVQRALAELESQLAAAAARVEQIRAPNGPVTPTPPPPTEPARRRRPPPPPTRPGGPGGANGSDGSGGGPILLGTTVDFGGTVGVFRDNGDDDDGGID